MLFEKMLFHMIVLVKKPSSFCGLPFCVYFQCHPAKHGSVEATKVVVTRIMQ